MQAHVSTTCGHGCEASDKWDTTGDNIIKPVWREET